MDFFGYWWTDYQLITILLSCLRNQYHVSRDWRISLCGTFTGESFFKDFKKTLIQYYLKWNLLRCIIHDGGKNMCGTGIGLVGWICKACENMKCLNAHGYLACYSLAGTLWKIFKFIMCYWIGSVNVNFTHSPGLSHHQFYDFLSKIETKYHDLPYHSAFWCFNRDKVSLQLFELRTEMESFLNKKTVCYGTLHIRKLICFCWRLGDVV